MSPRAAVGSTCAPPPHRRIGAPSQPYVSRWYRVKIDVEVGDERSRRVRPSRSLILHRGTEKRLGGSRQAHHARRRARSRRRPSAASGIAPDVELGGGGEVALCDRAAHDDDPVDALGPDARRGSERCSSAGPSRRSPRGSLAAPIVLGEERHRVRSSPARRWPPAVRARPGRSPRGRARRRRARSRGRSAPAATGISVRTHELEDPERVGGRLRERLVPVRRRDAEELELRAREGAGAELIASS